MKKTISILAMGMLLSLFSETAGHAATQSNSFVGGKTSFYVNNSGSSNTADSGVTSVYTDIYTPDYPTINAKSGSCAWPMITSSIYGATEYVQVGWTDDSQVSQADGVHYFYEINYGSSSSDYQVYSSVGPQANRVHGYRVAKDNTNWNGNFTGTVDGALIASYPGFVGNGVQYYEEIYGYDLTSTSFAGTNTNKAKFSNLRAFVNGSTIYSPALTMYFDRNGGYDDSHYKSNDQTSYLYLWDTRH
ncbi:hypothetical protein [Tumebacillus flagellatus]|uniref:Uncharacterized protein n=1 Tax=Tumebacillus flagellatus TaxID=1157490 RepID=A0A074LJJ1_9BACL|nr:hypothetical protein [Tumebacillus flagellatus]KEO81269.1 hypothetical protein EL26_21565 [Tumebacillus flagellatus]